MDLVTIGLFAVLAVLVFTTWRSSRKRKAAAEEAKSQFVVGAEVMTNYGLFGTIKAIDGDVVSLETTPKTVLRIHRGSIVKLVTEDDSDAPKSVEEAMARANAEAAEKEKAETETNPYKAEALGDPQYGERIEKKPVRRSTAKKTAE
jgi:preprotein translocase subunit YajC